MEDMSAASRTGRRSSWWHQVDVQRGQRASQNEPRSMVDISIARLRGGGFSCRRIVTVCNDICRLLNDRGKTLHILSARSSCASRHHIARRGSKNNRAHHSC